MDADAVALLICEDEAAPPEVNAQWVAELKASGEFTGKGGELAISHLPQGFKAKRLVLIGGDNAISSMRRLYARPSVRPCGR